MTKFILLFVLIGLSTNSFADSSKNNKNITIAIEDFAKPATYESVKISPNGKYLAVAYHQKEKSIFAILDTKSRQYICGIGSKKSNTNIGDINWVSNNRIVYTINESRPWDKTRHSTGELFAVNADCSKSNMIFGFRAAEKTTGSHLRKRKAMNGGHRLLNILKNDKKHVLIQFYPWHVIGNTWHINPNAISKIYKLNVFSGQLKYIESLPLKNLNALTDNNANVRIAVGYDDNNHKLVKYRDENSKQWHDFAIKELPNQDITPISFSKDNKKLYFTTPINNGTSALYEYDLELKKIGLLFHDKEADIIQIIKNFNENNIIAVSTSLAIPQYHYIDTKSKKSILHKSLQDTFSGSDIVITSQSDDNNQAVVYVYADNNPGDYYLFNTQTKNVDYLLSKRPSLYPEELLPMKGKSFITRDNQLIYGYITTPKQHTEKLPPLVVIPHGGPHGIRDYWQYNTEVQLLANRGYAVLQVNFRGSGGFGRNYQEAGYGKWGTLMQDDITDAVNSLIADKLVDKNKMCIYGASYGGYAALMGTIRTPDLFKCAIGSVGVYDLPLMFKKGDIPTRKSGLAYLKSVLGENTADLKQRSPSYNVDKIKANILLIHGKQDNRAPIEQVESLMSAMDKHNKNYQYLEISDEGHGYRVPKNKALVFKTILSFLEDSIGH